MYLRYAVPLLQVDALPVPATSLPAVDPVPDMPAPAGDGDNTPDAAGDGHVPDGAEPGASPTGDGDAAAPALAAADTDPALPCSSTAATAANTDPALPHSSTAATAADTDPALPHSSTAATNANTDPALPCQPAASALHDAAVPDAVPVAVPAVRVKKSVRFDLEQSTVHDVPAHEKVQQRKRADPSSVLVRRTQRRTVERKHRDEVRVDIRLKYNWVYNKGLWQKALEEARWVGSATCQLPHARVGVSAC